MIARMNLTGRNRFWRKVFLGLLVGPLLALLCGLGASPGNAAPEASAGDLIAAVNQLRKANNLPPYQVNPALMAAAQAHSEYQASIGQITHTGAGGSSAKDRAIAAGYGGGANVYVTENIAGGTSLTIQGAVGIWQGDSLHLGTMLSADYQDAGAGIAKAGGMIYYTLDVGYVAGSSNGGDVPGGSAATPVNAPPATKVAFFPFVISTPGPDGSITHIVQQGQSLWSIAANYGIELEKLLEINNLTSSAWIFPGDELLIKTPEYTPAITELPTESATESVMILSEEENIAAPTATRRPKLTFTPAAASLAQDNLVSGDAPAMEKPEPGFKLTRLPDTSVLLIIAVLVLGGSALIVLGSVLKRNE